MFLKTCFGENVLVSRGPISAHFSFPEPWRFALPSTDSEIVMVDLSFRDDFCKQNLSWDDFGEPTKLLQAQGCRLYWWFLELIVNLVHFDEESFKEKNMFVLKRCDFLEGKNGRAAPLIGDAPKLIFSIKTIEHPEIIPRETIEIMHCFGSSKLEVCFILKRSIRSHIEIVRWYRLRIEAKKAMKAFATIEAMKSTKPSKPSKRLKSWSVVCSKKTWVSSSSWPRHGAHPTNTRTRSRLVQQKTDTLSLVTRFA